ncbi:hypothetical protein MP228_010010 [Amoeboaphelidium protococcarum]|nr:hypothetical protein MP228_010010 [Amoeboaphelidium protococcarum]
MTVLSPSIGGVGGSSSNSIGSQSQEGDSHGQKSNRKEPANNFSFAPLISMKNVAHSLNAFRQNAINSFKGVQQQHISSSLNTAEDTQNANSLRYKSTASLANSLSAAQTMQDENISVASSDYMDVESYADFDVAYSHDVHNTHHGVIGAGADKESFELQSISNDYEDSLLVSFDAEHQTHELSTVSSSSTIKASSYLRSSYMSKRQISTTGPSSSKYSMINSISCLPKTLVQAGVWDTAMARSHLDNGRAISGEDAYFLVDAQNCTSFGVADGVGGWTQLEINPAIFAWELMDQCKSIVSDNNNNNTPQSGADSKLVMPWDLMHEAYQNVLQSPNVVGGSSTACLALFDRQSGMLHSANLGDSGFFVFRFGQMNDEIPNTIISEDNPSSVNTHPSAIVQNKDPKAFARSMLLSKGDHSDGDSSIGSPSSLATSSSSSLSSRGMASAFSSFKKRKKILSQTPEPQIVFETTEAQHYFNAPFQLAKLPPSISEHHKRYFMCDKPSDAFKSSFGPLKHGDLIIMASDGLFDNLFPEDIGKIVGSVMKDLAMDIMLGGSAANQNTDKENQDAKSRVNIGLGSEQLQSKLNQLSEQLTRQAAVCALSPRLSPFAKDAQMNNFHDTEGGKIDDITVICAVVVETERVANTDKKMTKYKKSFTSTSSSSSSSGTE